MHHNQWVQYEDTDEGPIVVDVLYDCTQLAISSSPASLQIVAQSLISGRFPAPLIPKWAAEIGTGG